MTRRERRDGDNRDSSRDGDRRDTQPDSDQKPRQSQTEMQEGDSLTALKVILTKVASLLKPLQLTPDESIRLVEELYGNVLDMDLRLAGEADDTRKSSVLSHIQDAVIRRERDELVIEYPSA